MGGPICPKTVIYEYLDEVQEVRKMAKDNSCGYIVKSERSVKGER